MHTLDCAELSVRLREAQARGDLNSLSIVHEPDNWRRFTGRNGSLEYLKPDLQVDLTTLDGWELRWFVEVDRATEHLPTVLRKCQQYQAYWQSGAEPHPVFPRVLWSVPDERRAIALDRAIQRDPTLQADLFSVPTAEDAVPALLAAPDQQPNERR